MAVNAEWLVEAMDGMNPVLSKEWIALIMLPAISSIAGSWSYFPNEEVVNSISSTFRRMCDGHERIRQGPVDLEYRCGNWLYDRRSFDCIASCVG